jgi:hypothetical protein
MVAEMAALWQQFSDARDFTELKESRSKTSPRAFHGMMEQAGTGLPPEQWEDLKASRESLERLENRPVSMEEAMRLYYPEE